MLRPPESPNARTRRAWRATRLIGLFVAALAACSGPGSEPFDPSRVPLVATFDAPPEGPMGERLAWVLALLNGEVDAPSVEHAPFVWGYTLLDRSSADDLARAFERAEQLGPYTLVGALDQASPAHWTLLLLRNGDPVSLDLVLDATPEARIERALLRDWSNPAN
jgi:hypothetical protein